MSSSETRSSLALERFGQSDDVVFKQPIKMIHESHDVPFFLTSKAYTDIVTFVLQLNASMFPRTRDNETTKESNIELPAIKELQELLSELASLIDKAPPDPGPRRFGNVSFRKWIALVETAADDLLERHLPKAIVTHALWADNNMSPALELKAYLLGGFGSAQRLDYGTGHELSFLAFLGCIWKLGGFDCDSMEKIEKAIVLGVVKPYLDLVRRLIVTYNLEPAGSHGVWGLDDHAFIPYIFGSAQLSPPITDKGNVPTEGSLRGAPNPTEVTQIDTVDRVRHENMYFGAIGFIYDVKKGPFWEHSPMLYDISGVKAGWAKINKGMIKMYIAEVLSKFPVVQHFPFGAMFRWEHDPRAQNAGTTTLTQTSSLKMTSSKSTTGQTKRPSDRLAFAGTAAPWVRSSLPANPNATGKKPSAAISAALSSRLPESGGSSVRQPAALSRTIPDMPTKTVKRSGGLPTEDMKGSSAAPINSLQSGAPRTKSPE